MKRNKNGFTLMEILGIIVLISFVFLISYTTILNTLKKSQDEIDDMTLSLVKSAALDYMEVNRKNFPEINGNVFCIDINSLVEGNYIDEDTINSEKDLMYKKLKVTYKQNNKSKYEVVNKCDVKLNNYNLYKVGNYLTIHDEGYYVLSDNDTYVTLLKENPLTVEEVNNYSNGYVNIDANGVSTEASNRNGYGGMAFYRGVNCTTNGSGEIQTECKKDYSNSLVKHIVDEWTMHTFGDDELKEVKANDNNYYKSRLIMYDELINNLRCTSNNCTNSPFDWSYSDKYWYWTMDAMPNYTHHMWTIDGSASIRYCNVTSDAPVVRPVINIYKSALES